MDSVVRIGGRAVEVHSGTAPGVLQGDTVLLEFAALEELCLEELGRVDGIVENRARAGLFVDPIRHGEVAVHVWFDSLLLEKADRLASDGTIFVSSVSLAIGLVLGLEADVRFRDKRLQTHESEMHLAVADLRFRVAEKGLVGFLQGVLATEPDLGPPAVFVEEVLANDAIGVSDFVDQDAVDALGELDVDDVVLAMSGDIDGAVVRTHPLVGRCADSISDGLGDDLRIGAEVGASDFDADGGIDVGFEAVHEGDPFQVVEGCRRACIVVA